MQSPKLPQGIEAMAHEFLQAGVNNAKLGLLVNLVYSRIVGELSKTKNSVLYNNAFCAAVQGLFYAWHRHAGTDNPELAMALPALLSFILTNYHAISVKKDLSTSGLTW